MRHNPPRLCLISSRYFLTVTATHHSPEIMLSDVTPGSPSSMLEAAHGPEGSSLVS